VQLRSLWLYGAQNRGSRNCKWRFLLCQAIFVPPWKLRPWHVPCLPYPTYATAENRLFPQMKTSRKVTICLHWFSYPAGNALLCKAILVCYCCDMKSRAACAQSFAPWQQATIEITRRDHSIIACSRHIDIFLFFAHIPFVVNHTINATPPERVATPPIVYNSCYTTACKRNVSQWTLPIIWETLLVSLMLSNRNSYFTMACRAFYTQICNGIVSYLNHIPC